MFDEPNAPFCNVTINGLIPLDCIVAEAIPPNMGRINFKELFSILISEDSWISGILS